MDFMLVLGIVVVVTILGAILVFILVISGKDILMALVRFFDRKACDVFIATKTRNISHYYKRPKEDKFIIDKNFYITNPDKVMNLDQKFKEKVTKYLNLRKNKIEKRLEQEKAKIQECMEHYEQADNEEVKKQLEEKINFHKDMVQKLDKVLNFKEQNYYHNRRAAFFYIESDPIPKDMVEFYSGLDCQIMDNIISRAISADPKRSEELRNIDKLKFILYAIAGGVGFTILMLFQLQTAMRDQLGLTI